MEQATYFKDVKRFFMHKFTNTVTKNDWRMELLERHPEFQIKGNEARKIFEAKLY